MSVNRSIICFVWKYSHLNVSLIKMSLIYLCYVIGTSASALHFQVYLLEGITRWNADRAAAAIDMTRPHQLRCFDISLKTAVGRLSTSIIGESMFSKYRPPAEYTGRSHNGQREIYKVT